MALQLDQAKSKARRLLRRLLWILGIVLFLFAVGYYVYSQLSYSDGIRSGQLVKISRRGVVFKTYEGTLNLSPNGMMTPWDFSAKNGEVARKLEALDGKMVKVHYEQRYQVFFWQGETDYIVDDVQAGD
ncbi:MAG: 6-phosphogluconate dehydrogenase [Saprospiraceae bacterium]